MITETIYQYVLMTLYSVTARPANGSVLGSLWLLGSVAIL